MNDRPYVRILEEHQSLAPIIGLEMRRNFQMSTYKRRSQTSKAAETVKVLKSRNQRAELMVLSGANHSSHINLIQSGIAISKQINIEAPEFCADGLFSVENKIFMRLFGQE